MEQLNLFNENVEKKILFQSVLMEEDWSYKLRKDRILFSKELNLTKRGILHLCRTMDHCKKINYGFEVYHVHEGQRLNTCVRFANYRSSTKESVYDYVNRCFDVS